MRVPATFILAAILTLSGRLMAAETQVVPEANVVPSLTAEQPTNPVSSKSGGPILMAVSARLGANVLNVPTEMIFPEFHFVAPNGNAILLRRELVVTSANNLHYNQSTPIEVPSDAQKKGAVISSSFNCNKGQYYATMRVFLMDADGNRSNTVQYTVHCNGG